MKKVTSKKEQEDKLINLINETSSAHSDNYNGHKKAKERPRWSLFVDAYLDNFNATEAYMTIYKTKKRATARTNASRLLTNANIRKEIERKLNIQRATESYLVARLYEIATNKKTRHTMSAVKALEILAKKSGMLKTKRDPPFSCDIDNIVIFEPMGDLKKFFP